MVVIAIVVGIGVIVGRLIGVSSVVRVRVGVIGKPGRRIQHLLWMLVEIRIGLLGVVACIFSYDVVFILPEMINLLLLILLFLIMLFLVLLLLVIFVLTVVLLLFIMVLLLFS